MRKRMKTVRGLWAGLLAAAVVLTSAAPSALTVQAEEADTGQTVEASGVEYQIYPTPHEMTYQDGEFIIKDVNIVYDSGIDEATKNRMTEVLSIKGKSESAAVTDAKVDGKTNILAGIYGSNGYVDKYVKEHYTVDETLFDHYGSYFLASNKDEIVILGLDTDAVFYGITSLKHIFNQMDGTMIRNFEMRDYADVNIRGFIEGYYGLPWSNEDRMSLMRFGGEFKMTSYIFAPKDDEYHKGKWRELYPAEELEKIKEMVKVGNDSKCRFVWTAHPFMGGFDQSKADEEIASLLRKFDQLYNAGVRQFGVLGDDVGNLPRAVVIQMMTAVSEWAKGKGDVYDTVFCPAGYNHSWQESGSGYAELNEYDKSFPEDVKIFWTGEAVCQPIEQKTLDHFRTYKATNGERRAPLFWLNWPVNDINHGRLMMGKGVQLKTDVDPNDLAGAVTNPMQESEVSKPAIFAVADYSWNIAGFDMDKSWADSFPYIDENASEELHTLAKHMSNPEPNGHGLVLPESEEIQGLINTYKTQLAAGTVDDATSSQLIAEMTTIIEACDGFHAKSMNDAMKAEILPFTSSLKDLCTAIRAFAQAQDARQKGNMGAAFDLYTAGSGSYASSQTYTKEMYNASPAVVTPGSTHLIPLAKTLEATLSGPMNDYVAGDAERPLEITAEASFKTWQSGKPADIIDGSSETYAWYNGEEAAGQYYQVNFSRPTTIYGVHIENGAGSNKPDDTFGYAKLKYKAEGSDEWKELEAGKEYGPYVTNVNVAGVEIEKVTAVRYECSRVGGSGKWPSMREFKVDVQPGAADTFTKEVIRTTDGWTVYSNGNENNAIDGDESTSVHYNVRQGDATNPDSMIAGDYFGVKLSEKITLGKIKIVQGNNDTHADYMTNCDLEWSNDGNTWEKIATFENKRTIEVDVSNQNIQAQYVRIKQNNEKQQNWFAIREFDVDSKVWFNSKVYTNVDAYKEYKANILDESAEIEAKNDITLEKDQYIGLKLDRIHEIKAIEKNLENADKLTLETSLNAYEWTTYDAKKPGDARYIRLINKTNDDVTFNLKQFTVNTVEFKGKSLHSQSGNYTITDPEKAFDGDRTTEAVYQTSQNAGVWFVYDLGQTIHFDTFKAVCQDGEHDFIRHGKFSVSTDGETWSEIMTLGSQDGPNEGEAQNTDEIGAVLPNHETSYNTKEVKDINKDARYLKFEVTRTKVGSDKWVRFSELEINGGAYVPSENDPTYESSCLDTQNGRFSYLSDMNLATAFIPAEESGSLVYHVSDDNNRNMIKIIQRADAISKADVSVRTFAKAGEWQKVGTLTQTVNEYVLPADTVLLDVKIEWKNTKLGLTEMFITKTDATSVDKAELAALIEEAKTLDTSKWTKDSADAYKAAVESGKAINDSAGAGQGSVDRAVQAIKNAKVADGDKEKLKGDAALLEAALKDALKDEDAKDYTARTWRPYKTALNAVEAAAAAENVENTSIADVEKVLADLEAAKAALVYDPTNMELAILESESAQDLIDATQKPYEVYTKESWDKFVAEKAELDTLINREPKAHPDEFAQALQEMKAAKEGLKTITEPDQTEEQLRAMIASAKAYEEKKDTYTKDSYANLAAETAEAEKALNSGDKEKMKDAIKNLDAAVKGLVLRANEAELKAYIEGIQLEDESKYTEETYKSYKEAYDNLKALLERDLTNVSAEEYADLKTAFEKAEKALVTKPENPDPENPDKEAPSAPSDLKVTDTTDTTVKIEWKASKDNVGVAGYEIFVNGKTIGTVNSDALTAEIVKLALNTEYKIEVAAFDKAGNKSAAASVKAKTKEGKAEAAPGTPEVRPGAVQTGDATPFTALFMMMLMAAAMFAGVSAVRVKKRK